MNLITSKAGFQGDLDGLASVYQVLRWETPSQMSSGHQQCPLCMYYLLELQSLPLFPAMCKVNLTLFDRRS